VAAIFLSYSRHNEPDARSLASDIGALGHAVWLDQELSGGQAWWDQILSQIRRCDVFVLALAPETLASTACTREYLYAAELGKAIVPVVISDGISTTLLPPALSRVQLVAYQEADRAAAIRLARAIAAAPPPPPLPEPLPIAPDVPISYLGHLTERIDSTGSLAFDEQSALLVDLRRAVLDPGTRSDARTLLSRLRRRRDLFAAVADQIDEILASPAQADGPRHPGDGPRARPLSPLEPALTEPEPRAQSKRRGPEPLLWIALALGGPIAWMVALRKDRQAVLVVLSSSLALLIAAAVLVPDQPINVYDDDLAPYLAYMCLAVMWWWPFARRSFRAAAAGAES